MARALLLRARMVHRSLAVGLVSAGLVAGCFGNGGGGYGPNPIDEILSAEFEAAGYTPAIASDRELCTRLHVDLLGVRPGAEELATCVGRDAKSVADEMQSTSAYRKTARRRFADRFQYSDYTVDVMSIRTLDDLVDDLYRGRLGYREFGEIALSHPGFVGRHIGYGQPDLVAEAAFRAFLGRSATTPERYDVGNLWKPWMATGFFPGDPEVDGLTGADGGEVFGYGYEPMVDPFMCEAGVASCASSLLGPASIEFPRNGRDQLIFASDLTAEDWHALREPGRVFTSLPMFWEAQVDEALVRYLGYDLGTMRPQIRQDLVKYFKRTGGNLKQLEYVIVTSLAYRQTAEKLPARPGYLQGEPFAFGPTKPMIAETFLASVGKLAGQDAGNCDWRYPNLPDWYYPGDDDLDEALDDVYPRNPDGTIDRWFRDLAIQMGGCPGTMDFNSFVPRQRTSHIGLMAAVAQEEAIVELCFLREAGTLLPMGVRADSRSKPVRRDVVKNLLLRATGEASDADVDELTSAALDGCEDCTAEAVARDLCAGLASGVEFLFY